MAGKVKSKKGNKASDFRRFVSPEIRIELDKLIQLFQEESNNKFAIGDQIALLIEHKGLKISELAKLFKRKRNRLSEIYHTAKAFPPENRDNNISFSHYENARKATKLFKLDLMTTLKELENKGITNTRDVTRHYANKDRMKRNSESADSSIWQQIGREELIGRCHNEDCRKVAERIDSNIVKIAWIDAPYGKYGSYKDGHHDKGGAALNNCDNMTTANVKELIDDLLKLLISRMAKGGVLLLCRPGGIIDPLHQEITSAADKHGWEIAKKLIWLKGKAKLGRGNEPYTVDTENIWVMHRQGDQIENHDNSSRSIILAFKPVTQRSITADESHLFAKPVKLCKFLIGKHSFEGELIFDACGCTGSFSVAASELNRQFIYCETNQDNFNLGSNQIYDAMRKQKNKVG